ncbi:MAG: cupin domain-containing protein [Rhodospirillaceae bacterium]
MTSKHHEHESDLSEMLCLHALQALTRTEAQEMDAHLAACDQCRREFDDLRSVIGSFAFWPTDVVRPPAPLWSRIAERISGEADEPSDGAASDEWVEPEWSNVAPGIACKLLAADDRKHRISMLVRLEPGAEYPPHTHAGVEELHLLHGELLIDDRKLYPGDYNLGQPGMSDERVWSETGCTCVLITSTRDKLR